MSDKKISQFNELTTAAAADLIPIVDVATNETKFIQKQNLVPDASFIENAVNKIAGQTLEVGKINLINIGADTIFTLPTAGISYKGKVLIVKLDNNPNFNLTINGAAHGSVILTKFKDSVIFSCVDTNETGNYFWFDISKSVDIISQTITNGVTDKSPSEDAVFDALALKEPVITKNSLSTPLVWTSANGVASFQPIPVLGDLTYYFTNTASDVATYYKQTTTPQVALTSLPFASVTDGQLLATFISEPSNPNRLSIPDGQYLNHLHLGKTGGTKDLQVRAEIWETTSAGVDIVKLADLGPSSILVGSSSTEYIIGYNTVEKTLSAVTSRIATKLYAVVGVSGSAPSVSIFQGDGSDSRSNLPAPVVDATNYVPYDGALRDVALGTKTLTAQDVTISSATASTPTFFDSAKKLITTTAQLWGTWVQTWASKATPVDADTIGFYNSATTFVGVKSTLLNLWTTYLLPKVQALGYLAGSGLTSTYHTKYNGTSLVNSMTYDNGSDLITFVNTINTNTIVINPFLCNITFRPNAVINATLVGTSDGGMTATPRVYFAISAPSSNYFYMDSAGFEGQMVSYKFGSTSRVRWATINSGGISVDTGIINVTNGGVVAGSSSINANAILQADSTSKGFLPPRMTNAQRTAITVNPATYGLMVYCTDATEGLYIYKSTGWTFII